MRWFSVWTRSPAFKPWIERSRCCRFVRSSPKVGRMNMFGHGTQTLLAALEIATGQVVAHIRNRRTSINFLHFMNEVVRAYPKRELHVVVDNLNIHKNEASRRWLSRHPQV